jgi:hypothetical protein
VVANRITIRGSFVGSRSDMVEVTGLGARGAASKQTSSCSPAINTVLRACSMATGAVTWWCAGICGLMFTADFAARTARRQRDLRRTPRAFSATQLTPLSLSAAVVPSADVDLDRRNDEGASARGVPGLPHGSPKSSQWCRVLHMIT